jgi:hypothetical protein
MVSFSFLSENCRKMEWRPKPFECLGLRVGRNFKNTLEPVSVPTKEYETGVLIEALIRKHCG